MAVIFNSERLACYGDAELTLEGTVGQIGAYDPYLGCEPEWLCHPYVSLHAIIEQAHVAPTIVLAAISHDPLAWTGEWPTPDLWFVVHPQSGITDAELLALVTGSPDTQVTEAHPVPVRVTGHFDDPAASTCVYTEDYTNIGIAPEDAARGCRNTFVVTSITSLAE